ncbi:hypothetical protein [Nocardia brasiliensis]|uniref:Uncharacterized protein n=1 Tax=Nocardia brasiliensis (strain ATCC 700358 / HUJEG-1) TaxID=1133849 RepID=K0EYI4_NOCB7|nr:hypothetical protein [Nocardia brasiliensis]AFU02109.1 hypothetical protein O3I_020750 [Nocardia brasiliensis ATCC 700358]OCF87682.1 hypothetical protein AW168_24655 [Nocardia brasiliensis]
MLPTLNGRIQTRVLALSVIGAFVAVLITPLLPTGSLSLGQAYRVTLSVLLATVLVGVLWELLYHFLQQFRWEKDWPTLFGFLTVINEGALMWVLVDRTTLVLPEHLHPSLTAFLIQFVLTWMVFWLIVNGPLRVPFHRWRFQGGRFL